MVTGVFVALLDVDGSNVEGIYVVAVNEQFEETYDERSPELLLVSGFFNLGSKVAKLLNFLLFIGKGGDQFDS